MTGKERAAWRSQAQTLDPIVHIGKEGVTEGILHQVEDALTARELIKGTVQQNSPTSAREACDMLCERTGAESIGVVGRKFVLYRFSPEKHAGKDSPKPHA